MLDSSGSCSTLQAITPNTALAGTTVPVTITGIGFVEGMTFSFDGGNGPRPVVSNVELTNATNTIDTITATVTIPYKKQPGKDPVWDLRASTGGVLPSAFRVIR